MAFSAVIIDGHAAPFFINKVKIWGLQLIAEDSGKPKQAVMAESKREMYTSAR